MMHLAGCATARSQTPAAALNFASVPATIADTITVPPGYRWRTLIAWGDALFEGMPPLALDALTRADQEMRFGTHNDMLALIAADFAFPPPTQSDHMILCVNNEYATLELMYPALRDPRAVTPAQVEAAYAALGISIVELKRTRGAWRPLLNAAPGAGRNRRITPFSPVLFSGPAARHPWIEAAAEIFNAHEAHHSPDAPPQAVRCGTGANCAGGTTPWGTYLSAEENFDEMFFGSAADIAHKQADQTYARDAAIFGYPAGPPIDPAIAPPGYRIAENPHGPAAFGWIVEIDPHDPAALPKKRTALGRKKNECATSALTRDGRIAVYMGDDERNEHVYKFVSRARFNPNDRAANADLLDDGALYCARFEENGGGRWIAINADAANAAAEAEGSPIRFAGEADVLMRVREAARLLGATPMDRPEDIEAVLDANWRGLGPVLIVCTNNRQEAPERPGNPRRPGDNAGGAQSNLVGHILRIDEADQDCGATHFTWDVFAMGGDPNAAAPMTTTRAGAPVHVSNSFQGEPTTSGERFACPDNLFVDSGHRVWISTDGSDNVFADCNDSVLAAPLDSEGPRPIKRFLVGPVGAEICGPLMAPDERAFFCAIQHPGESDAAGVAFRQTRWAGAPAPSSFPDGGWPRSAVVVITREDGGRIGD